MCFFFVSHRNCWSEVVVVQSSSLFSVSFDFEAVWFSSVIILDLEGQAKKRREREGFLTSDIHVYCYTFFVLS